MAHRDGFSRPAHADDAASIAELYVRTLRDAYADQMPPGFVDPVDESQRAAKIRNAISQRSRTYFLSLSGAAIVGFCGLSPARDQDLPADVGEVTVLGVHGAHRRRGHGRALLDCMRDEALSRNWHSLVLWVVASNAGARAFYDHNGFTADGTEKVDERLGFTASIVRYRLAL